jgi:GAF domain
MQEELTYFTDDKYIKLKEEFATKEQAMQEKLWIDSSIGQFDEVIRLNYTKSLDDFTQEMIIQIAEFANSYSGVFYIYDASKNVLHANASYAYQIEDLNQKEIKIGQGLVGQVAQSKKPIFFDNLPPQNIHLHQSPTFKVSIASIFIIPLTFNELIYGVVELVFIRSLEPKVKQVIEMVCRNTAIVLESITNNTLTKKLLKETQEKAEMLRAQEEELRQNMEELQSTQEAMARKQQELETINMKMKANEGILQKALAKMKESDAEVKRSNEEMRATIEQITKEKDAKIAELKAENEQLRAKLQK